MDGAQHEQVQVKKLWNGPFSFSGEKTYCSFPLLGCEKLYKHSRTESVLMCAKHVLNVRSIHYKFLHLWSMSVWECNLMWHANSTVYN